MTAGLVSIVIAEQRICRHVFYCTMKLDGEPRPGSREGGRETGTVIKRTRVLNVSLNVSQIDAEPRQRFRTLAGAVISNANKSFVSDESGNCIGTVTTVGRLRSANLFPSTPIFFDFRFGESYDL